MDTASHSQSVRTAAAPGGHSGAHAYTDFSVVAATAQLAQPIQAVDSLAPQLAGPERLKMARDLHDGYLQDVTATLMQLRAAERAMQACAHAWTLPPQQDPLQEHLTRAIRITEDTVQRMRRQVGELRRTASAAEPLAQGDDSELCAALFQHLTQASRHHAVTLEFDAAQALTVSAEVCHEVVQIAGEALANALKHGAPDRITCSVRSSAGIASVAISDNGGGFRSGGKPSEGYGLRGMRERAELLCGRLEVVNNAALGVIVRLQFPCGAATH